MEKDLQKHGNAAKYHKKSKKSFVPLLQYLSFRYDLRVYCLGM